MFIIFGNKLYGRVCQVPGVGYIETVFIHIYYFPVFPDRSYIVANQSLVKQFSTSDRLHLETKYGFHGVRVSLNWFSILMAYFRIAICFVAFFAFLSAMVFPFNPDMKINFGSKNHLIAVAALFGTIALYAASRRLTHASVPKANEIREMLGLPTDWEKEREELAK